MYQSHDCGTNFMRTQHQDSFIPQFSHEILYQSDKDDGLATHFANQQIAQMPPIMSKEIKSEYGIKL
jgi:hypothetical protein